MRLGLNRRNVGRLVLLAWAAALAWLARRELYRGEAAAVALGTARLAPGAAFYAVYAGGRQIGQLNITVDTLVDGVRLSELLVLDLPRGDSTRQMARGAEYNLSRSLRLRNFTTRVFGWDTADQLVAGIGEDSILSLTARDGTEEITGRARYRVRPDAVLPAVLPFRAALGGRLRVGERIGMALFEPATGITRPVAVTVTAESVFVLPDSAAWDSVSGAWAAATTDTVQGWLLEHDAGGAPVAAWVDRSGGVIRAEVAGGFTIERSAFEMVRVNYRMRRGSEPPRWRHSLPGVRGLVATRRSPDTLAAERRFLVVLDSAARVRGTPVAAPGGRQEVLGDTIVVHRRTPADTSGPPADALFITPDLPLLGRDVDATVRRALAGDRVRTRADSAAALTHWVARQIASDTAPAGSGSAQLALRSRRGTPDAKARLLATLARSARIPARVVNGLAVSASGAFAHSWTEIWVDGWVAADPTFGHYPASASLVRLSTGGRSRPVDLLPIVASARFLPLPAGP